MQIKDVEKLTGLSSKTIRFYEEKGLLEVARNANNTYRDYSEANVQTLKKIKIFRYFGFSLSDIAELLTQENSRVQAALEDRVQSLYAEEEKVFERRQLCQKFSKVYGNPAKIDEFNDIIDFKEADEFEELREVLVDSSVNSLWSTLLLTSVWIAWIWSRYFKNRQAKKSLVTKKDRREWKLLPVLLLGIILALLFFSGISIVTTYLLPENWFFYESNRFWGLVMIGVTVSSIGYWLFHFFKVYDLFDNWYLRFGSPILILLSTFLYLTNTTVVTEQDIILYSSLNLSGKHYRYEEVEKIEAWYGASHWRLSTNNRQGHFYYAIWLDGKKVVLSQPNVNDKIERFTDSYQELEEFDERLVNIGIPKTASAKHADKIDYDEQ
ncbi:MerR family transcriptional regulator [Streptococcus hillyeri]|uniref:MerR family transcriptional regulator n=1 Tax=Streptococcus hillyeri TaxID=2282420 RepID=A0A3L9DW35_9STRE|nr:MerR family transcriptional regulator [Streptococcus hillyeri]RLY04143.1 MerR family transcriptional regulator [Streptococcus hillyeri]